MFVGLTLAGSLSSHSTPAAPEPVSPLERGTLTASQPRLEWAVLRPGDLPGGHIKAPKATVRRLPDPERCSTLLDPSSLMRAAHVAETTGQATTKLAGPTKMSRLTPTSIHSLLLKLTGGGRTTSGCLTLRRAGRMLSVLRLLGTDEVAEPLKLVNLTLNRLTQTR
jgi:hypothetical protein